MYVTWGFSTKWVDVGDGPEPVRTPPPVPPPFVPTYDKAIFTNGATGISYPANEWFFATAETAQTVMQRLRGLAVEEVDGQIIGPVTMTPASQRFILFSKLNLKDGKLHPYRVNAGELAANWTRNPEDKFPGLALMLAQWAVEEAGKTLLGF
jgi:hypothetical protein